METHNLGDHFFFDLANEYLKENVLKLSWVTILHIIIINAPSSTRNKKKERDPYIHQARKGKQLYLGIFIPQFGCSKVRYRRLEKNVHRLFVDGALRNLVLRKKTLLRRSRSGMQAICR